MRPALPPAAAGAPGAELTAALLDALAFSAYPDAPPALRALRAAGCALVVVSNWDCSLHERLEETGLAPLVDGAVASAELGAAKPERAIFERALALAGVAARARVARRRQPPRGRRGRARGRDPRGPAGARRPAAGGPAPPAGVPVLRSLDELPALVARADPYAVRP